MKIPTLALALILSACGPAQDQPTGTWHGEVIDFKNQPHDCTLELTPTAPDRVHIHLEYGAGMCDGDGAFIIGDLLLPDAGGEITFDEYALNGTFFSAIGYEYRIEVSPEGARYVSPGRSPGSGAAPTPIPSPEGAK